jgi:peptide/nickel transport system substrate-binding protein
MGNEKKPASGSSFSGAGREQKQSAPGWTRRRFLTAGAVAGGGVFLGAPNLALANAAARSSAIPLPRGGEEPPTDDLPREQTLILQNPESVINNPGWFNIWVNGGGGASTGLHQLMMDTLWFIDPDAGIEGVTHNSLATGPAEYNADFTEMTVHLRDDIYWSDGEQFTADDVVFTVQTQIDTPSMNWSGQFSTQVKSVEAVDAQTVHFVLQAPNSRFNSLFSVRWNAAWIMPEHIFSGVDNPLEYDFNPPVGLGPYTLHSFDPNGTWYIWQKREDWDRTAVADFGEPAPQYVIYRNNMQIDNRLIEMRNGDLDMIHDLSPEGMFSIVEEDENVRGWFPGFPYAHPDPTLPMFIFNHQNEKFQDPKVRWALALMLDARAMSMASYRGAATLSAISIPPTGTHPDDYHAPMQEELINFELDTGERVIKPYNPDIGLEIADMVREEFGDDVPTDEDEIRRSFGYGWWNQDLEAAGELLRSAGLTDDGGQWTMPDGSPFEFSVLIPEEGVINRLGTMAAQLWSQAGVQVTPEVAPDIFSDRMPAGDYEASVAWSVETWGGHPDLSFFLDSYHSSYIVEADSGELQPARNWMRWQHPDLDRIIEEIRTVDFEDLERNIELGKEFVRLHLQEMPNIPVMSYNVFVALSERYWTGYPTAENPYANPVNNWANSRYILTQLKPAGS